jgi:hypothetical protein
MAVKVREVLDEVKGASHAYVILFLSIGRFGNINNNKSIADISNMVPRYFG